MSMRNLIIADKIGARSYAMPARAKPFLPVSSGCVIGTPGLQGTDYQSVAAASYNESTRRNQVESIERRPDGTMILSDAPHSFARGTLKRDVMWVTR